MTVSNFIGYSLPPCSLGAVLEVAKNSMVGGRQLRTIITQPYPTLAKIPIKKQLLTQDILVGYYMHGLPLPPRGLTPSCAPSRVFSNSTQAVLGGLGGIGLDAHLGAPVALQSPRKRPRCD